MPGYVHAVRGQEVTGVTVCASQAGRVPPARPQCPAPPACGDGQDLLHAEHLPDHVPPGPGALPPRPGLSARPGAIQVTSARREPPPCHSARTWLCLAKVSAGHELCKLHGAAAGWSCVAASDSPPHLACQERLAQPAWVHPANPAQLVSPA